MMVIFHIFWALDYFDLLKLGSNETWFGYISIPIAVCFVLLVGVCLTISYSKAKPNPKKYFARGLKLLGLGFGITLVSLFLPKGGTVWFGILHLIGVGIILAIPLIPYRRINLALGSFFIALGLVVEKITVSSPLLALFGFNLPSLYSVDYFPLFKWFGVILVGLFIGNTIYAKGKRHFKISAAPEYAKPLCFLGKHSLLIYFLHMVIILGIVYLIKVIT